MFESITTFWQNMTDEKKLLVRQLAIAALALHIVIQLIGFLLPIIFTAVIIFWVYKNILNKNPRIMH